MNSRVAFDRQLLDLLPELRKYALIKLRNEAEADDLMSRATLKMLNAWEQFQPGTNFRAWAYRVTINEMLSEFRRLKRNKMESIHQGDETTLEHFMGTPAPQDAIVMTGEIMRAVNDMRPDHREVLQRIVVDGESYEDTARATGSSMNSIKSRIWRARASLIKRLAL